MKRGKKYKFQSNWIGPYKVIGVLSHGVYRLQEAGGAVKDDLVHRDRLKRCIIDPANPPRAPWTETTLEEYDEPTELPNAVELGVLSAGGGNDTAQLVTSKTPSPMIGGQDP
jgi:hypothetical protein